MAERIKVLVVDDAVVIRRLVSDVLAADPELDVVGTAANGRIALQKIAQLTPDVVTLDVEMPELDGIETLKALRQTHPALPVIMFSTLTERGAVATLDALALGASDYVTKPANVGSVAVAQERVREELIPKIKLFAGGRRPRSAGSPRPSAPVLAPHDGIAPGGRRPVEIIAIGVSTGGPNALAVVIPALPADLPVPVVIVQHMPPMFTKFLADRLAAQSRVPVCEAAGGEVLGPGTVYVAPGNYHMTVEWRGGCVMTAVNQEAQENSCRPAVDVLFRSVARVYGAGALGVVLTGMGQDGLRGAESIHAVGGQILAQDEATSVVWGMPGYVAGAGLADRVLPIDKIAADLVYRTFRRQPIAAGAR